MVAHPLERREQLLLCAAGDTRSFVGDIDQDPVTDEPGIDTDRAVGRVAQRVVEQVRQDPLEQTAVGHRDGVGDFHLDPVQCGPAVAAAAIAEREQGPLYHLLQVDLAQFGLDHTGG